VLAPFAPCWLRKVIADNFPQWVFSGAKVAERTIVKLWEQEVQADQAGPVSLL